MSVECICFTSSGSNGGCQVVLMIFLVNLFFLKKGFSVFGMPPTRGGDFGRGEFRGEIFAVKKSGKIFPLAKFLQRVTGEYCEFRHAQRCTKQREGTRDVFVCNMQWLCPE